MRAIISILFWVFVFSFIIGIFGDSDMQRVMQSFTNNITQTINSTIGSFSSSISSTLNNLKGVTNNMLNLNKSGKELQ